MKILIISNTFPYPPDTGEKIRNFNLIKHLSQNNHISLILLVNSFCKKEFLQEVGKYCSSVETVLLKRCSKLEHLPGIVGYLISGKPIASKFVFSKEMVRKIIQKILSEKFDIIQIEHSIMAPYINAIPKNNRSKKVLTFHNIGFVQFRRMFKIEKNIYKKTRFLLNWFPMKRWELKIAENFDLCITMSDIDKKFLINFNPKLDISVVPNGIDTKKCSILPTDSSNNNILFIGKMEYEPNVDAVLFFYKEIFQIIKKQILNAKFFIVGSNPPKKIMRLGKDKNVIVKGYVDCINPYYENCALSIVPLRAGGGTRLKILEAMALGRPVVSTSIGAEGLEVEDGKNIMIADNTEEFAEKVMMLLRNKDKYKKIVENARRLVEDWEKISKKLNNVYINLLKKASFDSLLGNM